MSLDSTDYPVKEQFKSNGHSVLLVGDSGTGKSSLICRYTKNKLPPRTHPTSGVEFIPKIAFHEPTSRTIRMQIWDISGQPRYLPSTLP